MVLLNNVRRKTLDVRRFKKRVKNCLPWFFGSGMAAGNALLSYNCTVPAMGRCAGCGSCLLPLASLAGWAILKSKNPVYSTESQGSQS